MSAVAPTIGYIAIGRNEGVRLERCLAGLTQLGERVVYVDSGSTDKSVVFAKENGVMVVELDTAIPFTAARARNAGYETLIKHWPETDYIHFIDGDCEPVPDFPPAAADFLANHEEVGMVTGHCREMFPEKTIYNRLCDQEWRGPIGEIGACGGIFMIRAAVFEAAGKFNPSVIAAEDDELCIRVRKSGHKIFRIDQDMCWHDADMRHFSQWWRRAVRAGYAYGLVGDLHPGYFKAPRVRALLWGGVLPSLIILGLPFSGGWSLLLTGLYLLSITRTWHRSRQGGVGSQDALVHTSFQLFSTIPNFLGMLNYRLKKMTGKDIAIVEYK